MTDNELLQLAAKAAGDVTHEEVWKGEYSHFERNGYGWNPLTDDGDALRLMVQLKLYIDWPRNDNMVYVTGCTEQLDDDPYAATRRAIVRAAAQIGSCMK
jgi:hypothetical protein